MNETLPQHGPGPEGVQTPPEAGPPQEVAWRRPAGSGAAEPAAAQVAVVASLARTLPEGDLSDTQPRPEPQPTHGTSVMPAYEAAAEAAHGAAPAPAFGTEIPAAAEALPEDAQHFAGEQYFPEQYGSEQYGSEQFGAEGFAAEQYASEQYASEQYVAAEQYAAEQYGSEQFAAEQFAPEPFAPEPFTPEPFAPEPFALGLAPEVPQPAPVQDGEEDDGLPGGPTPASSGFSWRLPGMPAPAPVSQGGIPNEFDHLFRDSGAESRHSLLPGQGPIGVSVPGPVKEPGQGSRQSPDAPQPGVPGQAGPGQQGGGAYQSPDGYPQSPYPPSAYQQDGYPQQPYLGETGGMYDQGGFQTQAQVPVGAPTDEAHTQALPRVQVQYGGGAGGNPDLLLGTGGPSRSSSSRTMVIAVGVLVVLVVIAAFAFSGGGTKKNPAKTAADAASPTASAPAGVDPEARSQADAIYAVIQQSKGLTSEATDAITAVEKCGNVQQAAATFTDIATKRQAQSDAVGALPADKLPDGAALISHLQQAWQFSATSERELAAWAQDNATCTGKPGNNDNRNRANNDGGKAGSFKVQAADEWNAAAAKTAEPAIKHTDL